MTGQLVRYLSGHVRGRTGRTTPPLKGVSVRCPVSVGKDEEALKGELTCSTNSTVSESLPQLNTAADDLHNYVIAGCLAFVPFVVCRGNE
jgi:hypothetical protein